MGTIKPRNPRPAAWDSVPVAQRPKPLGVASREEARRSRGFRNELLYTGRRSDPETGLQLNRHRFYHQQLGRWVSRDPIGYEGSQWNLYEYVNSRPVHELDPEGTGLWQDYKDWWQRRFGNCAPPQKPKITIPIPREQQWLRKARETFPDSEKLACQWLEKQLARFNPPASPAQKQEKEAILAAMALLNCK